MKGKNHIVVRLGPHSGILCLESGVLLKLIITENALHPTVGGKLASSGVCEFCLALMQQNFRGGSYLNISNK